jgi:hypothetical protein
MTTISTTDPLNEGKQVEKHKHDLTVQNAVLRIRDPGCLSRIPDPNFYPSRTSDPGFKNSNKRER